MGNAMPTKSTATLIAELSDAAQMTRADVKGFLELLEDNIYATVKSGTVFKLGNMFRVKILPRKARMVRNPQTGETFKAPASKRLKFTAGKALKELIPKKVKK